ncbi:MAG: uL15 family ribosomal protein [Nitrososphaeraceae archaeon]
MATRFRKSRRQRGSRFCGWGQIGQHRQSGSRGGIGGAGKHKHFWIRTVIEEPDHFGHDSTKPTRQNRLNRWVNLRDVNDLAFRFGTTNEHGKLVLDLRSIGYDKLLGGGTLLKPIVVRVAKVSATAKQKIELAGGDIVLNEELCSN